MVTLEGLKVGKVVPIRAMVHRLGHAREKKPGRVPQEKNASPTTIAALATLSAAGGYSE